MLLTRDFSRLPQMEGFFAGYVTSGGARPSDKGGGVVGGGMGLAGLKNFLGTLRDSVLSKNKGARPRGLSPGSATGVTPRL